MEKPIMKLLVTGANGFVGKNLISTLAAKPDCYEVLSYDIENTFEELREYAKICDFVVHLAGVNRPKNAEEFYKGNGGFTEILCDLLHECGNSAPILISSSIQASLQNDYGKSKKEGEDALLRHYVRNGSPVIIYRFANLFGKWCRPNYNSVVATWCYNISHGKEIQIHDAEAEITLCYIDDVVREIIHMIDTGSENQEIYHEVSPVYKTTLGHIAETLYFFKNMKKSLLLPDMNDALTKKLYSTYLSYLPKDEFSYPLITHADERGSFTEVLKSETSGQVSVNISKPGITKGNHWHHTKNEKFLVVHGKGTIRFRNIYSDEIIEYHVSDKKLEVVDIPTGYTHSIINEGTEDMVTIMWANERFDTEHPDTFYEEV